MAKKFTTSGIQIDARDAFGNRIRKHFQNEEAADAFERRLNHDRKLGRLRARQAALNQEAYELKTLPAAVDYYLAHRTGIKASSLESLKGVLARFAARFQAVSLLDFCPRIVDEFFIQRQIEVAPSTLAAECAIVKSFFDLLSLHDLIPANPAAHLNIKRPAAQETTQLLIPYSSELALLEEAERDPKWKLQLLVGLDAGLSGSESTAVTVGDIDLKKRSIFIRAGVNRHSSRTLPLTARLADALVALLSASLAPRAPLFLGYRGKAALAQSSSVRFRKLRASLGLYFRLHDLRHTFATRLAQATSNGFLVSYCLGHRRPYTSPLAAPVAPTTPMYVHQDWKELRETFDRFEANTLAGLEAARKELESTPCA